MRSEQRKTAESEAALKRGDRAARRRPPQAQPGSDRHRGAACASSKTRIAATEGRLTPLDERGRGHRAIARWPARGDRRSAGRAAAHGPPAAAGAAGAPGGRAAIGAHRHRARRGAAGHAAEAEALVADLPALVACATRSPPSATSSRDDLRPIAEDAQRMAALIEERQKQQTDAEKALGRRARARRRPGAAGRQSQRP